MLTVYYLKYSRLLVSAIVYVEITSNRIEKIIHSDFRMATRQKSLYALSLIIIL